MTPPPKKRGGSKRPNKVFGAQINARDAIVYYNKKMYIEKREIYICVHILDFHKRILILGFMKVARYSDTCMMPRPSQRPAVPPIDVKNVKKLK